GRAPVVDTRLLDFDRPDPGGEGPRRQMAVAHHLAVALVIEAVAVPGDPGGGVGLRVLGQERVGSPWRAPPEVNLWLGEWHEANIGGRKTHGGVLLCRGGTWVDLDTPRVRRPFSTRYPQHSIIPPAPPFGPPSASVQRPAALVALAGRKPVLASGQAIFS